MCYIIKSLVETRGKSIMFCREQELKHASEASMSFEIRDIMYAPEILKWVHKHVAPSVQTHVHAQNNIALC